MSINIKHERASGRDNQHAKVEQNTFLNKTPPMSGQPDFTRTWKVPIGTCKWNKPCLLSSFEWGALLRKHAVRPQGLLGNLVLSRVQTNWNKLVFEKTAISNRTFPENSQVLHAPRLCAHITTLNCTVNKVEQFHYRGNLIRLGFLVGFN